jgi:transposase-like protein
VLVEHAASGLSLGDFARREGIAPWRLYRWRRRLDEAGAAPGPTPAVIELRATPRTGAPIEIVLQSGVTLRVSEAVEPSALARVVAVLR